MRKCVGEDYRAHAQRTVFINRNWLRARKYQSAIFGVSLHPGDSPSYRKSVIFQFHIYRGRARYFNFSCSTFDARVMIQFVCNGTAKSRSCRYFFDCRAKAEYTWSQIATSGPGGYWKLTGGSVAGRWTDTLWTKTDAENLQAAAREPRREDIVQFSFKLSRRNSYKQEDWNRLKVYS